MRPPFSSENSSSNEQETALAQPKKESNLFVTKLLSRKRNNNLPAGGISSVAQTQSKKEQHDKTLKALVDGMENSSNQNQKAIARIVTEITKKDSVIKKSDLIRLLEFFYDNHIQFNRAIVAKILHELYEKNIYTCEDKEKSTNYLREYNRLNTNKEKNAANVSPFLNKERIIKEAESFLYLNEEVSFFLSPIIFLYFTKEFLSSIYDKEIRKDIGIKEKFSQVFEKNDRSSRSVKALKKTTSILFNLFLASNLSTIFGVAIAFPYFMYGIYEYREKTGRDNRKIQDLENLFKDLMLTNPTPYFFISTETLLKEKIDNEVDYTIYKEEKSTKENESQWYILFHNGNLRGVHTKLFTQDEASTEIKNYLDNLVILTIKNKMEPSEKLNEVIHKAQSRAIAKQQKTLPADITSIRKAIEKEKTLAGIRKQKELLKLGVRFIALVLAILCIAIPHIQVAVIVIMMTLHILKFLYGRALKEFVEKKLVEPTEPTQNPSLLSITGISLFQPKADRGGAEEEKIKDENDSTTENTSTRFIETAESQKQFTDQWTNCIGSAQFGG